MSVDFNKLVESLHFIVDRHPCIGHYHLMKSLYYADKVSMLERNCLVSTSSYVAMQAGPVPENALGLLDDEYVAMQDALDLPEEKNKYSPRVHSFYEKVRVEDCSDESTGSRRLHCTSRIPFSKKTLTDADLEYLQRASDDCAKMEFYSLCDLSHEEELWRLAWGKAKKEGAKTHPIDWKMLEAEELVSSEPIDPKECISLEECLSRL